MKFRISTALLFIALIAVGLGWWADRNSNRQIQGLWRYPTPDIALTGYSTTLEIRADGTFTKVQRHRTFTQTFSGEYKTLERGLVQFHVTEQNDSIFGLDETPKEIDQSFRCRCAVDKTGYLVVYEYQMWRAFDGESDLRWETYHPAD